MTNLNNLLNKLSATTTTVAPKSPSPVTGWAKVCKDKYLHELSREVQAVESNKLNKAIRAEMEMLGLVEKQEIELTMAQEWAAESWLVNNLKLDRAKAVSLAAIVKGLLQELKYDGLSFAAKLVDALQGIRLTSTDGVEAMVEMTPEEAFNALTKSQFLRVSKEGDVHTGIKFWKAISIKKSRAPEVYGELERLETKSIKDMSVLTRDAIYALEDTKFNVSKVFLEFVGDVFAALDGHEKAEGILQFFKQYEYIIAGCMGMEDDVEYVSEFFEDWRGRMYQGNNYGPNSQASDFGRACQSFPNVSTDYDDKEVLNLLHHEMEDMCSAKDEALDNLILQAIENPVEFFLTHFYDERTNEENHSPIKKLSSFIRYAEVYGQIERGYTTKPVVDVLVGLDAKGSGPQLGGLMFADEGMLALTGFSQFQLEDVYTNCIKTLEEKYGITGVSRAEMKKPFMAVFYGAGLAAMMQHDKVEDIVHIYNGLEGEAKIQRAKDLRQGILDSFGPKIKQAMSRIKWSGIDFNTEEVKLHSPLSVKTIDGGVMQFNYKFSEDIYGEIIEADEKGVGFTVEFNDVKRYYASGSYQTDIDDVASGTRTGFVNLIQHVDSLLGKLIVVKCKDLGCVNIVSIHDCFRVDINSMDILKKAIKWAYTQLFGGTKDEATYYLPGGKDIVGKFFDAIEEATKDEYKKDLRPLSQFKGFGNGSRHISFVKGVRLQQLIDSLGSKGIDYFSK